MSFIYCRYIGNISAIYMFIQAVWRDTSSDAVDGNILATYIIHTLLIYWKYISNIWSHQLFRQIHLQRQGGWQYSSKTYRLYIGNILAIYQQYKCSHRQFGKIHLERREDGRGLHISRPTLCSKQTLARGHICMARTPALAPSTKTPPSSTESPEILASAWLRISH